MEQQDTPTPSNSEVLTRAALDGEHDAFRRAELVGVTGERQHSFVLAHADDFLESSARATDHIRDAIAESRQTPPTINQVADLVRRHYSEPWGAGEARATVAAELSRHVTRLTSGDGNAHTLDSLRPADSEVGRTVRRAVERIDAHIPSLISRDGTLRKERETSSPTQNRLRQQISAVAATMTPPSRPTDHARHRSR